MPNCKDEGGDVKDYELAQVVAQARRDNALARNERILRRRTALFMPLIELVFGIWS